MRKRKSKRLEYTGFTLIEQLVVIGVLGILILIAIPIYKGCVERAAKQACNNNCMQLERMYQVYLIAENKEHTDHEFRYFLEKYEVPICPEGGDIVYMHGSVRCLLHFKDVPFL